MEKKCFKIWAIIATALGVVLLAAVIVLAVRICGYEKNARADGIYRITLENSYQRSYNELIESVNGIEAELSKAIVSNSADTQLKTLSQVSLMSSAAQNSISALPINACMEKTAKVINQTGDYAATLNNSLIQDRKPLSEAEKSGLTLLRNSARQLKTTLDGIIAKMDEGGFVGSETNPFTDGISKAEEGEFPRLEYDGPFSDGAEEKVKTHLSGKSLTAAELETKLKESLSDYKISDVKTTQRINKGFDILMFTVTSERGSFDVNMSEKGGFICQIDNYGDFDGERGELETTACIEAAESFARKLSYDVKPVYVSKTLEGCIYINLCYVENGVIIYPDMLKLTVDTSSGKVTSLEGYKYLLNHRTRNLPAPAHSVEEAAEMILPKLIIKGSSLVLIPKLNDEKLCYEFRCADGDDEFFIYINANTLAEEELLKIVKGSEGYTTM